MATRPRQVLPGTTYLISRRCSERRFFLRPLDLVNQIFVFVLAAVAARYGIVLHAFCVMSDHYHLVLTDVRGELPNFHRDLDALVARAVNRAIGHAEAFWDRESYSAIPLLTAEDIVAKCAYVLANPVAAGAVRRGREWPGLWSGTARIGGPPTTVERPAGFFRKSGPLGEEAQLVLRRPDGFKDDQTFRDAVQAELERLEDAAARTAEHEGRRFMGARRARALNPFARAKSVARRGAMTPRVAGLDPVVRAEALRRWLDFLEAYREALAAWRAGMRDVLFPPGTWAMRIHHGARCAAPV